MQEAEEPYCCIGKSTLFGFPKESTVRTMYTPAKKEDPEISSDEETDKNNDAVDSLQKRRIKRQDLICLVRLLHRTPPELMQSSAFTMMDGECVRRRGSHGSNGAELWELDLDSVHLEHGGDDVDENDSREDASAGIDADTGAKSDADAGVDADDGADVGADADSGVGVSSKNITDQVEPPEGTEVQVAANTAGVEEGLARSEDVSQTANDTESADDKLTRTTQQLQAVEDAIKAARRDRDRAGLLRLMRERIQLMTSVETQKGLRNEVIADTLADVNDTLSSAPSVSSEAKLDVSLVNPQRLQSHAAPFVDDGFQGKVSDARI